MQEKSYFKKHSFVIYWLAHTIGYLLFVLLVSKFTEINIFLQFLLGGLIVQTTAKAFQAIMKWKRFRIDFLYFKWIAYHSGFLWLLGYGLRFFTFPNIILQIIAGGLAISILAKILFYLLDKEIIQAGIGLVLMIGLYLLIFFGPYILQGGDPQIPFLQEILKPDDEEASKSAFDYINEIRSENGLRSINWDERAYKLALFRSKDMNDRNYFDHVSPEGKCVVNLKGEYGFSGSESLAENLAQGARFESAVDLWMTSRGHRFNLLYSTHKSGAIACYYNVCTFLGVNYDDFGSECASGEEGLAFWRTASRQPGEI